MTATAQSSTASIGQELVSLCRAGKNLEAIDRFYSPQIVSIEPEGGPDMPAEQKGLDAIRGKNVWWQENHEIHSVQVDGPFVAPDQFAVHGKYDVTFKPSGQRFTMEEMALYSVKNGKIIREQFFYNVPGK
jgi:hypothetical protein